MDETPTAVLAFKKKQVGSTLLVSSPADLFLRFSDIAVSVNK